MKESTAHHAAALIAGLNGEPEKFRFTGVVVDTGRGLMTGTCVCGCAVRWEFRVRHVETGAVKSLGSTCIHHYSEYCAEDAERMREYIKRMEAERRERERKAKLAMENEEALAAKARHEEAHDLMRAAYENFSKSGQKAPRPLWEIADSWKWRIPRACPKQYARPKSFTKWYNEHIVEIARVLAECEIDAEEIARKTVERETARVKSIARNWWLIEVFETLDNGRSGFIIDMLSALKRGDDLEHNFSDGQVNAMRGIFAKYHGRNGSKKNERAHEYFDLVLDGECPEQTVEEFVNEKAKHKVVNASKGIETNGLPF